MIPSITTGGTSFDVGRYPSTLSEIETRFVNDPQFGSSTTRRAVWQEWTAATEFLETVAPIACVWLAGSFTTSKLDPSDIDCLYWFDVAKVESAAAASPEARAILSIYSNNLVKSVLNLRVDSFVAAWRSIPKPSEADYFDWEYYQNRGHWDDFWQRERITPKESDPRREDTLLRRGYLEVAFHGFE